jgi:polyhydroxyalkanoate synthesis regulator phasin
MVNDIENKLDEFFNESTPAANADAPVDDLQKLKSVVLSIDWEITDTCLSDLMQETERLLPVFENDRFTHALLRMLNALGRYIRKRKASAHPVAINRVMSVYSTIEKLIADSTLTEEQRRLLIANEIAAFKKLKQQVEAQRAGASQDRSASSALNDHYVQQRKFEAAMGDVEERLAGQVADLKAQVEYLQKEIDALRDS